jgi:hypothetical protein
MRHSRHFAALALLFLAACGEQGSQIPTSPDGARPSFDKGIPCPTTQFPFNDASQQIRDLYPNGAAENAMVARAFDISKKWSQCKVADPQGKVGEFVQTLLGDFLAGRLNTLSAPSTADRVSALIALMYEGVGLTDPGIPVDQLKPGGDIGIGLFIPGQPLLVRTSTRNAGTKIPANAFTENTLITIYRLRDDSDPLLTEDQQSPPFYDINASNNSGTHDLNGFAPLGICVDQDAISEFVNPAIGHNRRVPGEEGGFFFEFEVLDPITTAEFTSLGLTCTTLINPATSAMRAGSGTLGDLALGAWEAAQSAAVSLFLPQPAQASSAVGQVGVGGRASSYSPFGIVDQFFGS